MIEYLDHEKCKKAKKLRSREIKKLKMCQCYYPLTRYRNGSGHNPHCPAHKYHLEKLNND